MGEDITKLKKNIEAIKKIVIGVKEVPPLPPPKVTPTIERRPRK